MGLPLANVREGAPEIRLKGAFLFLLDLSTGAVCYSKNLKANLPKLKKSFWSAFKGGFFYLREAGVLQSYFITATAPPEVSLPGTGQHLLLD